MTCPQTHKPISGRGSWTQGLSPSFVLWSSVQAGALGRASSLWARPHGTPARPIHEEMVFASSIAMVLSIPCSYSNILFQPDIEMLLKNYVQDPRENIFTSNQRGLGSCHKRQWGVGRDFTQCWIRTRPTRKWKWIPLGNVKLLWKGIKVAFFNPSHEGLS